MDADVRTPAQIRASGPIVTAGGKRLPLSVLGYTDLPGLLELFDHRARSGEGIALLGQANDTRETLARTPEAAFAGQSVLGIRIGRTGLIRGLFQTRPLSSNVAEVSFLLDDSIDSLDTAVAVLSRLIDNALAAGFYQLEVVAPETSNLFAALRRSGYPLLDGEKAGHRLLTIRQPAAAAA
jgi:hypothetical protein